jgi:hypothetical protein
MDNRVQIDQIDIYCSKNVSQSFLFLSINHINKVL